MIESLFPIIAELTPEEIGRVAGKFVAISLMLAVIAKCVQISRRSTTSGLCVSSLTCLFIAWLLGMVEQLVDETPLSEAIFAVGFVVLLLTSLILGVIGLIDYRRQAERFVQGKTQAIFGILFSFSLLAVIAVTAVQTIMSKDGALGEMAWGDDRSQENQGDAGAETFEDLNFRYDSPRSTWVPLSVKRINPIASLAYMRKNPETWFMVIGEKIGIENEFNTEALAEIAQTNMRAGGSNVRIGKQYPEEVNGVKGLRFEATATVSGRPLKYSTWVAAHNGFAYQLLTFSQAKDRDQLKKFAVEACSRFHLIDDQLVTHVEGVEAIQKHRSSPWGYEVDFTSDPGWIYMPKESLEVASADFVGMRVIDGNQVSLGVVPIRLPSAEVDKRELLARLAAICLISATRIGSAIRWKRSMNCGSRAASWQESRRRERLSLDTA